MNAVFALYQSTIGKKVAMAVTGVIMLGWVTIHMLGNLQVFLGSETLNHYGELIQSNKEVLWIMRLTMLSALMVHVWSAVSLALGRSKRGTNYEQYSYQAAGVSSRFMRVSGVIILIYIIFHLLDLTVGVPVIHPTFEHGGVYANLTASMANPAKLGVYLLAALWVALHVYHATYSVLQTLGLNQETLEQGRKAGFAMAFLIGGGNMTIVLFSAYLGIAG